MLNITTELYIFQ